MKRLDFVLNDGAAIFESRSVLGGTTFFRDFFLWIKWQRFVIIKLPFLFKTLYKRPRSFREITDPFLPQVFSALVLILTVPPEFKVGSRFWVSGSIDVLVVKGLCCGITGCRLVRIGRLNNLWAGYNLFSSGWEFKNSIDKQWSSFANFDF